MISVPGDQIACEYFRSFFTISNCASQQFMMKMHRISCRFIPYKPHEGTFSSLITSDAQNHRPPKSALVCTKRYHCMDSAILTSPLSRAETAVPMLCSVLEISPLRPTASPGVKFRSMLLASNAESARVATCPYFKICSLRHRHVRQPVGETHECRSYRGVTVLISGPLNRSTNPSPRSNLNSSVGLFPCISFINGSTPRHSSSG